ncbi:30S ribosomal protein S8 [archaeon]|nr:30S ribosomal protein S8 [archaeon]|tara:strand:+ start:1153 stop:1545 length:393 start_codon:yes stop_codon:yes gene_type:complete
MALNDPLSNVLSHINNCEKTGKIECTTKPTSNTILKVLEIMKEHHYVGDYEIIEDGRGNIIKINLLGNINKCNVIKPRFSFKLNNLEKFEKRFLLARDFGLIIVSTNKGLMTHMEAKEKKLGGRLIAYVY